MMDMCPLREKRKREDHTDGDRKKRCAKNGNFGLELIRFVLYILYIIFVLS